MGNGGGASPAKRTDWVGLAARPVLSPCVAPGRSGGTAVHRMASAPTRLRPREAAAGGRAPAQLLRDSGAAPTSAARGAAEPVPRGARGDSGRSGAQGRGHGDPAVSGRESLAPNFAPCDVHSRSGIFTQLDSPPPGSAQGVRT